MGLCITLTLHAPQAGDLGASLTLLDRRLRQSLGPLAWGCEELRLAWGSEVPAEAGDVVETGVKVEMITKVLSMSQSEAEVGRDLTQALGIAILVSTWNPLWTVVVEDDLHFVQGTFGLAEDGVLILQGGLRQGAPPTDAARTEMTEAVAEQPAVRRAVAKALALPESPAQAPTAPTASAALPAPADITPVAAPPAAATPSVPTSPVADAPPPAAAPPIPAPATGPTALLQAGGWSWTAPTGTHTDAPTAVPLQVKIERGAIDGDADSWIKARVELVAPPRRCWRLKLGLLGLDASGRALGLIEDDQLGLEDREAREFRLRGHFALRHHEDLAAVGLWVTEQERSELKISHLDIFHGPVDADGDGWVEVTARVHNPGPAAGELCIELTTLDGDGDPAGFERSFLTQPVPAGPSLVRTKEFITRRQRGGVAAVGIRAQVFRLDGRRIDSGTVSPGEGWAPPAVAPAPPPADPAAPSLDALTAAAPAPAPAPASPPRPAPTPAPAPPPAPHDAWWHLDAGDLAGAKAMLTAAPLSYPDQSRLRRLFNDRDEARVIFALEVATATDFRSAASSLRRLLGHASPQIRLAAVQAAGALAGPSMTVPVRRLLDDADPQVRAAAATALAAMG